MNRRPRRYPVVRATTWRSVPSGSGGKWPAPDRTWCCPNSPLLAQLAAPEAIGFLRREYDAVSPDGPEHFAVVHAKMIAMLESEPELDPATFAGFGGDTLVLQGDRDEVTVEHSLAVARALPNGRLAVLPGSHGLPIEQPGPVNALLASFLWQGFPEPLFG